MSAILIIYAGRFIFIPTIYLMRYLFHGAQIFQS